MSRPLLTRPVPSRRVPTRPVPTCQIMPAPEPAVLLGCREHVAETVTQQFRPDSSRESVICSPSQHMSSLRYHFGSTQFRCLLGSESQGICTWPALQDAVFVSGACRPLPGMDNSCDEDPNGENYEGTRMSSGAAMLCYGMLLYWWWKAPRTLLWRFCCCGGQTEEGRLYRYGRRPSLSPA